MKLKLDPSVLRWALMMLSTAFVSMGLVAHGRSLTETVNRAPASLPAPGAADFARGSDYETSLSQFGAQPKHDTFSELFPPSPLGHAWTQFASLIEAQESGDTIVRRLTREASDYLRTQPEEAFGVIAESINKISSSRFYSEKLKLLRFAMELQVPPSNKVALLAHEIRDNHLRDEDASPESTQANQEYVAAALESLMSTSADRNSLVPVLREALSSRRGRKAKELFTAAVRGYSKELAENIRGY